MGYLLKICKMVVGISIMMGMLLSFYWSNAVAFIGWALALYFFISWILCKDKVQNCNSTIEKIREQDLETFNGLWNTIKNDGKAIKELRNLNTFLMSVLESYAKNKWGSS